MDITTVVLLALGVLALLAAASRAFDPPEGVAARAAVNTLAGLGGLLLLNATSAFTGLQLGVNLFTALVAGVLGLPGLALLLLIQWVVT